MTVMGVHQSNLVGVSRIGVDPASAPKLTA